MGYIQHTNDKTICESNGKFVIVRDQGNLADTLELAVINPGNKDIPIITFKAWKEIDAPASWSIGGFSKYIVDKNCPVFELQNAAPELYDPEYGVSQYSAKIAPDLMHFTFHDATTLEGLANDHVMAGYIKDAALKMQDIVTKQPNLLSIRSGEQQRILLKPVTDILERAIAAATPKPLSQPASRA